MIADALAAELYLTIPIQLAFSGCLIAGILRDIQVELPSQFQLFPPVGNGMVQPEESMFFPALLFRWGIALVNNSAS
ncbi:MAG: hypothetical protein R3281_02415 [Balneolaceae bacterium]|nr:hypothetical protein [Balneolaceae bacterium]